MPGSQVFWLQIFFPCNLLKEYLNFFCPEQSLLRTFVKNWDNEWQKFRKWIKKIKFIWNYKDLIREAHPLFDHFVFNDQFLKNISVYLNFNQILVINSYWNFQTEKL